MRIHHQNNTSSRNGYSFRRRKSRTVFCRCCIFSESHPFIIGSHLFILRSETYRYLLSELSLQMLQHVITELNKIPPINLSLLPLFSLQMTVTSRVRTCRQSVRTSLRPQRLAVAAWPQRAPVVDPLLPFNHPHHRGQGPPAALQLDHHQHHHRQWWPVALRMQPLHPLGHPHHPPPPLPPHRRLVPPVRPVRPAPAPVACTSPTPLPAAPPPQPCSHAVDR